MRQTNEQRAATERLRALAGGYRVKQDAEGWPMIPGRLGRIEWHCDGVHCHGCPMLGRPVLAVYTDRRRVHSRLLAIVPSTLKSHTRNLAASYLPRHRWNRCDCQYSGKQIAEGCRIGKRRRNGPGARNMRPRCRNECGTRIGRRMVRGFSSWSLGRT
jgi:hypothetical protein